MCYSKERNREKPRSKSAITIRPEKLENTKTQDKISEELEGEVTQDRKSIKSAKARLERTQAIPKPRNPRDHPMVKVVGKTRAMIGQAKKAKSSTAFIDPEKSQLGTIREKEMKKKAVKLAKQKDCQVKENTVVRDRIVEFLSMNPIGDNVEVSDAVSKYGDVRNLLIKRNISLSPSLPAHRQEQVDLDW